MSEQTTQDAGTATTDAGGTQTDAGQKPASQEQVTQSEAPKDAKPADEPQKTEEVVYEFKAPDGVELDKTQVDEFTAIAKELKLPKDAAQKVVDLAIKREQARAEAFTKQVSDWAAQVKADPELGKDENLAAARKFVDTFGDDEIKGLLNSTGMGNHPAVVRFILKASKTISEDKFIAGKSNAEPAKRDAATVLYGNP